MTIASFVVMDPKFCTRSLYKAPISGAFLFATGAKFWLDRTQSSALVTIGLWSHQTTLFLRCYGSHELKNCAGDVAPIFYPA